MSTEQRTWRLIAPDGRESTMTTTSERVTLVDEHRLHRLSAAADLLSDLDRCEHGRHRGDVCGGVSGCNGPSHGNPFLEPGQRIGTTLHASHQMCSLGTLLTNDKVTRRSGSGRRSRRG